MAIDGFRRLLGPILGRPRYDLDQCASVITTWTGRRYDVINPRPQDVCVEDIAHHLSQLCRFSGGTDAFYSVAQHAVIVSYFCEAGDEFAGLHHDDTEAYINDLSRPLKHHADMRIYRDIEARNWQAIASALQLPEKLPPSVKSIDNLLVVAEGKQLMAKAYAAIGGQLKWINDNPALDYQIVPWSPAKAESMFLKRHYALLRGVPPNDTVKKSMCA